MLAYLTKLFNQIRGLFPSPLPQGSEEFESWVASIAKTYKLPTVDSDSIRWTLATIIMHQSPQTASKAKYFFVKTLRAAASKQVANAKFMEIKDKQIAELNKKQEPKQAAAPALSVVSSGPKEQGFQEAPA